ncbi:hypothetical protein AYO38_03555 [bacterium SCGC AG-212-C10]|nr:hypothetical protein AYO38_03555 [bacterium SCGC AG-212-C10]
MPSRSPLSIDEVVALLSGMPGWLEALSAGLPAVRTHPRMADSWSANDILAHLRSCSDVWGEAIARILAEDEPVIRAINPRSWIRRTNYGELQFAQSLEAYCRQREDLLVVLRALATDDWRRAATITGAGAPLTRTVHTYAEKLAVHERTHRAQLQRAMTVGE